MKHHKSKAMADPRIFPSDMGRAPAMTMGNVNSGAGTSHAEAVKDDTNTELKELFDLYMDLDTNVVNVCDLEKMIRDYGFKASKGHFRKLLDVCDIRPSDDQITFEKYEKVMNILLTEANEVNRIKKAFELFDIHKDGCITFTSLCELCEQMETGFSEDDIHEMMMEADIDKDGVIDIHDFAAMMKLTDLSW